MICAIFLSNESNPSDPIYTISIILLFAYSVIFHEIAHGYIAKLLGDDTAYIEGRITFNPISHIDLFYTILLPIMCIFSIGIPFGGAKPVPINPYKFKNPARDFAISASAGPLSNLLLAICGIAAFVIFFNHLTVGTINYFLALNFIGMNVLLATFNLVPIPPLDGSRILRYLLPENKRIFLDRLEPLGLFIIIMLIVVGIFNIIIKFAISSTLYFLNYLINMFYN